MKFVMRGCLFFLFGLILFLTPAAAAERPFYQGKNVNFVINFAAGGPTDIEGRIVARHLAKHVPGQPAIVVQNMPGAGGVIGINFLGEVAKPDGLTITSIIPAIYFNQLAGRKEVRFDYSKFNL